MDGGLLPGAIAPRNGRPQKLIMVALIVDIRAFEPSRGDRPRERDHQADLAARDANRAVEEAQARIESAIGQLTRASLMQPSAAVVVGDRVAIPPQMMFQDLGPLALVTGPVRRVPGLGVGLEVGPSEPVPGVHMTSQIPRTDGHSVIMPVLLNPSQMTMAEFHAFLNQLYVGPNRARLN
jgi:hypothetical protein